MAALIPCYSTGDNQGNRFTLSANQIPALEKGQPLRNSLCAKLGRRSPKTHLQLLPIWAKVFIRSMPQNRICSSFTLCYLYLFAQTYYSVWNTWNGSWMAADKHHEQAIQAFFLIDSLLFFLHNCSKLQWTELHKCAPNLGTNLV